VRLLGRVIALELLKLLFPTLSGLLAKGLVDLIDHVPC
jgi:hypothetical protein